jgi:hypothetical protein
MVDTIGRSGEIGETDRRKEELTFGRLYELREDVQVVRRNIGWQVLSMHRERDMCRVPAARITCVSGMLSHRHACLQPSAPVAYNREKNSVLSPCYYIRTSSSSLGVSMFNISTYELQSRNEFRRVDDSQRKKFLGRLDEVTSMPR